MREQTSIHIDDSEIGELTLKHYGREYRPGHMDIGGDESGGMCEVDAASGEVEDYYVEMVERWMIDGYDPECMLTGMVQRLVADGHLKAGIYIVEGSWG